MQYLWIPISILFVVLIVCDWLLERLTKKGKLIKGSRRYYVLYGFGTILPSIAIIVIFFYPRTDTFGEWVLTSVLGVLMMSVIYLMSKGIKQLKHNGIVIPIGIISMFGIGYLISILSIENLQTVLIGVCMGAMVTATKGVEHNKKLIKTECIVVTIVGILMAASLSSSYLTKPLRRVEEQVKLQDLTKRHYEITQYQEARRGMPIKLKVFILNQEDMLEEEQVYTYVNDQVNLISSKKY